MSEDAEHVLNAAALFAQRRFAGPELRNFRFVDPDRTLKGETGASLLARTLALVATHERRERALQEGPARARERSASVLLANLACLTLNRVDNSRFLAVSFDRNDYVGKPISWAALTLLRDVLLANGLIEGSGGGRRIQPGDIPFGWLTRMRPTEGLKALFAECEVSYASIKREAGDDLLILRDRNAGIFRDPPIGVEQTRPVMVAANLRIDAASIELPEAAWARITDRRLDALELDEEDRAAAGDQARKALVRLFKGDWKSGGRLYGGWWIGLPKEERKLLTIDGEPVVELDYGQLHPSILYARTREEIEGDPYVVGRWTGPAMRQLGKLTFARMLNTTTDTGDAWPLQIKPEDADKLAPGLTWEEYFAAFQRKHEPISEWFWIGEGLRLQREDSDVAIGVLEAMDRHGITTLPIHDSFIVQRQHRSILRLEMVKAYRERFYYHPIIK